MTRGLEFEEAVAIDPERLARLYADLGDRDADRMICDAMEDLALALARIGRAYAARDLDAIAHLAQGMERLSARIGLAKLEQVAESVRICAARGDVPGLDATLARLSRVGDRSLSAVWDPQYHSV
ncbi:hypothetical protein ACVDG3_12830 [Meridianimarinicoccus sp. RP-17]|uniref:hypothetical protein n=1 Tax=Meridianimarinicoccus zhengii TaxID=2056810 RepID=UPI000DAECD53|nr:hypothetical protein [Phycocomes zhengii]